MIFLRHHARHRLIHRLSAWIALVAMVFAALMPVFSRAEGGTAPAHVEVCSISGMKSVLLAAKDTPAAPQKPAHDLPCPVCAMAGSALLPPATQPLFFSALQAAAPPARLDLFCPLPACLPPASRGPPLVA